MVKMHFSVFFGVLLFATPFGFPQEDVAKRIYSSAADSVVFLYIEQSGKPVGIGSGFIIKGGKIITNAHVAEKGNTFLMAGPAKIPLTLDHSDASNDLALLIPAVELVATGLDIQSNDPAIGETVFAIGNPEGLEKTISQGIVSAMRDFDGRRLIQMTSPVSHGSSGGPVLNKAGQVIGVTVGMLQEGQNLNFAIPATAIQKFLIGPQVKEDPDALLSEIKLVATSRGQYSQDPDSDWQKGEHKLSILFEKAISISWNNSAFLRKIATEDSASIDVAIKALRRIAELEPTAMNYKSLADKQYWSALFESDDAKKTTGLSDAEKNARLSISKARTPDAGAYVVLARVLSARDNCPEAQLFYKKALFDKVASEDESAALHGLTECANALKLPEESERYFRMLVAKGYASGWDWDCEGGRLSARGVFVEAGKAYETAAQLLGNYGRSSLCNAGRMYYFGSDYDAALSSGRSCIAASEGKKDTDSDLATSHYFIADILNGRGVYSEALNHAKEAIALQSSNPWAYDAMAQSLLGLNRPLEAITAAQQAIKLTDGKYSFMHFRLGSAYFETRDWRSAEQSFRQAAELDKKDEAAAYNVALCLLNQGYYRDSANWFEEVLRRNPQYKDKADILERIRTLRGR